MTVTNADLPLDKAEIIAFFLESMLFGISSLLYIITIWTLVTQRKSQRLNSRLVSISTAMMFFNVMHMAVDIDRVLQAFFFQRDLPGGPAAYYARLFDWSELFKTGIFVVQTVLADCFAIYRCHVVWNRFWIVVFPSMSVVATLATGIGVVVSLGRLSNGSDIFASTLKGWITSFFVLTLCTNFMCTSSIAGRIWFTTRKVKNYSGNRSLMPIVIVLIESGALYAASCIALVISYLLGSNAQYIVVDGAFPIISIAFNMIIVRIALGIAHGGTIATTGQPSGITSAVVVTTL
ncbi:hypothetical protein M422DRAFT_72321 [Sphaerobolus stellatus SS14]|uniref:Serpentine receptor class gamma n=1 Tax=Sphaerobolus stellatus (strain SS14) TaxID=990650 RepID=A0A0C9TS87_SPHS4|nr:hypothetical protein M422DRAFT_72321 [Sphaerobolus stellatus SS14]